MAESSMANVAASAMKINRLVKNDPPVFSRVLESCLADYSVRENVGDMNLTKGTVESI